MLSNGQIVEQGTHKELLKQNGTFAKMWADQVNADRRAQSLSTSPPETSGLGLLINDIAPKVTETPVTGYDVETAEPLNIKAPEENAEVTDVILNTGTLVDEPVGVAESIRGSSIAPESENVPVAMEPQESQEEVQRQSEAREDARESIKPAEVEQGEAVTAAESESQAPKSYAEVVASEPKEETEASIQQGESTEGAAQETPETAAATSAAPIAFPASADDNSSSKPPSVAAAPSGGITFSPDVNSPPSRSGTPDPDTAPKRKRISSQNFQRLAKKITMVRRNSSSASFDADASTSSLESPGNGRPRSKSKLKRKSSTGPPK